MGPLIRGFQASDAAAATALHRASNPLRVESPEAFLHRHTTVPERAQRRLWVASEREQLVGFAEAGVNWAAETVDTGGFSIVVHPDRRGAGIGSRLYDAAQDHLASIGVRRVYASAEQEPGQRFLESRGFRETRRERISVVDPRTIDAALLAQLVESRRREGYRLATLAELAGRERDVFDVYVAAAADVPEDEPETNIGFEEWRRETLEHPDLLREASFVALHRDLPVALAFVEAVLAEHYAGHDLTGTLPGYRRRGLARLVKLAAIRACADLGVRQLVTSNDTTNVGMLALNDELGFVATSFETTYVKR